MVLGIQHEVHTNEVQRQFIVSSCVRHSALTSYYVCFRLAPLWGVCLCLRILISFVSYIRIQISVESKMINVSDQQNNCLSIPILQRLLVSTVHSE